MALLAEGVQMRILAMCGNGAFRVAVGGSEGILHVDDRWAAQLVIGIEIIVKQFKVTWANQTVNFHAHEEDAMIIIKANRLRGTITAAEVFAGISGWSAALTNAGVTVSLMVERDELTAPCCAKKFQAPCMTAGQFVMHMLDGTIADSLVVLHDDVSNPQVWVAMGLSNVGMVVGSPPCPPWSHAAFGKGLNCEEGMCFLDTVLWIAESCIPLLILENVGGLATHQDFSEIVKQADDKGMKLILSGIFESKKVVPVQRKRWLGTFVYKGVDVEAANVQVANALSFIQPVFHPVATSPSIDVVDVTHIHVSEQERQELLVSPEAVEAMSNSAYAPEWLREKVGSLDGHALFQGRFVQWEDQHSAFMAMYGSQHLLDPALLVAKGLHTRVWKDDHGYRYISPWEMLAALGYSDATVIPADITKAWRVAGNGISHAHAWLAVQKTHIMLGALSPFKMGDDICEAVKQFRDQAIHLSECQAVQQGLFWVLHERVEEHDEDTEVGPDNKKRKCGEGEVSPTMSYDVIVPMGTKEMSTSPQFARLDDPRGVAVGLFNKAGCVVVLQHSEGHWIMFVNGPHNGTVADFVVAGLPHAKASHFTWFRVMQASVDWETVIASSSIVTLVFCPKVMMIMLREPCVDKTIQIQSDVTWTVQTALSYAAVDMQCNPDALALQFRSAVLTCDEYLTAYDTTEFRMTLKACMPAYVSWDKTISECKDPGIEPATPQFHRIVARHPLRKVIRTCVFTEECDVNAIVQMLFPVLFASVSWTLYQDKQEMEPTTPAIHVNRFEIQWNGYRPLPVTAVVRVQFTTPVDTPANQFGLVMQGHRRAVRSPFRAKVDDIYCPKNCTVAQMAASYFLQTKANVSVLCEVGTRVIDPCTLIEDIDERAIVNFRVCPLVGGAKNDVKEGVKNKIKEALSKRGVPDDVVQDRVQTLLSKVPVDHIAKYKDNNDEDFWQKLKDDASDAKFRLIMPKELKAFQVAQRKNKQQVVSEQIGRKPKVAKTKPFVVDAATITVDANHFRAGGEAIGLLDSNRFGPDQTGSCVVSAKEASQFMHDGVRSCDPLALLIVGDGVQQYGKPFSLPAHLPSGSPVVVSAVMIQYGDVPVEFTLKLPTAMVQPLESTVVEFCIYKDLVDTALPLHYLGVQVPALRGSNLLAVWSIRSWNKGKSIHYSQAQYWHGYLRIADTLLPQVLQRSGQSGVFVNPKSSEKKHDARFTVIPVPAKTLQEVLNLAKQHAEAMGVVKLAEGFAIRARREDATQLRSQLSPESAFVEQTAVGMDEDMYVLRNVPQVSKEELTGALVKMGWQAKAVKSQGVSRWLIAAKDDAPATHLVVNNSIIVIERLNKKDSGANLHVVAKEVKVELVMDIQKQVMTVSTTSRYAEIQAQVEEQIAMAVENKMAVANAKIEELSNTLQQVQVQAQTAQSALANDVHQMKEEQNFTRNKLAEVEASVAASGQTVITQMQAMFLQMEEKMATMMSGDKEKRARTGDIGRADPFATKS